MSDKGIERRRLTDEMKNLKQIVFAKIKNKKEALK